MHIKLFLLICRLAEKFTNIESENIILRQQALQNSPLKIAADILSTPVSKVSMGLQKYQFSTSLYTRFTIAHFLKQTLENGDHAVEENRTFVIVQTLYS